MLEESGAIEKSLTEEFSRLMDLEKRLSEYFEQNVKAKSIKENLQWLKERATELKAFGEEYRRLEYLAQLGVQVLWRYYGGSVVERVPLKVAFEVLKEGQSFNVFCRLRLASIEKRLKQDKAMDVPTIISTNAPDFNKLLLELEELDTKGSFKSELEALHFMALAHSMVKEQGKSWSNFVLNSIPQKLGL
jgi:hypothetical protein